MCKKNILIAIVLFLTSVCVIAQPSIQWQKSLGGLKEDFGYCIQQTTDGGYITIGMSKSSNGNVTVNNGEADYWVVKLDSTGAIEWQKSFGGTSEDYGRYIQETYDGGYIITGYAYSNDGDVIGNHGNYDYWLLKLNSTGGLIWKKCFGGTNRELGYCIQQTSDSGYVVAGRSASNDGDVTGNHGGYDFWVIKLGRNGALEWQNSLGGSDDDFAYSLQQTFDGGYIVAGSSKSSDGDLTSNNGYYDYWIVKLDSAGSLTWQKSLGGSDEDQLYSIQQTTDAGYVMAGISFSNDGDVSGGNHGDGDYWVVKLDSTGTLVWQNSLGGAGLDGAFSIQQTFDGGYVVSGTSYSNNGDVSGNHGSSDFWIVKLTSFGSIDWQKSLGGIFSENDNNIQQTADSGYVVVGISSSNNGDVTGNHGSKDYWVVKLLEGPSVGINKVVNDFEY